MAENRAPYAHEIVFLFKSLLVFGGQAARCTKIAYFIDAIDGDVAEELAKLGVVLKVVPTLVESCPHANKLHTLLDDDEGRDVTVALDTDMVVGRDFAPWIGKGAFAAKPAEMNPIPPDRWSALLERLGSSVPATRYLTHHHAALSPPYYNSGALFVRNDVRQALAAGWRETIDRLQRVFADDPELAQYAFYTGQLALNAVLARLDFEQLALPVEMNFPTHTQIDSVSHPHSCHPYLFHHHHRFDEQGRLLGTGYDLPDEILRQISDALQVPIDVTRTERHAQARFDNAEFWDNRYRTDFKRGSGLGSRGKYKDLKVQWIGRVVEEHRVRSVLDVGCGDLVVVGDMPLENYTGVDVSEEAVRKNQSRRPDWKFIAGNFLELQKSHDLKAELVMCLDVLIHQHDFNDYQELVAALVRSCTSIGLIAAFETPPRAGFRSDITAYHEPITRTLRRLGVARSRIIGTYRDTSVVEFEKRRVPLESRTVASASRNSLRNCLGAR